MKEKTIIRPTKDLTRTGIPREQLLALLQGDDAMRAWVQTVAQEVLHEPRPVPHDLPLRRSDDG
jgi:hypothetical protein